MNWPFIAQILKALLMTPDYIVKNLYKLITGRFEREDVGLFYGTFSAVTFLGFDTWVPLFTRLLKASLFILRKFYGPRTNCSSCGQPFEVPRVFCGTLSLGCSNRSSLGSLPTSSYDLLESFFRRQIFLGCLIFTWVTKKHACRKDEREVPIKLKDFKSDSLCILSSFVLDTRRREPLNQLTYTFGWLFCILQACRSFFSEKLPT